VEKDAIVHIQTLVLHAPRRAIYRGEKTCCFKGPTVVFEAASFIVDVSVDVQATAPAQATGQVTVTVSSALASAATAAAAADFDENQAGQVAE